MHCLVPCGQYTIVVYIICLAFVLGSLAESLNNSGNLLGDRSVFVMLIGMLPVERMLPLLSPTPSLFHQSLVISDKALVLVVILFSFKKNC